jgi:hypothetical protein
MLMFWQIEALHFGDDSGAAQAWLGSGYLASTCSAQEIGLDATESIGSRLIETASEEMEF